MKTLLLVLLASGPLMTPASPDPKPTAGFWPPCGYDEVYSAIYYYEYPGGPECGLSYIYCEHGRYHEGCATSYYSQSYFSCECE